MSDRVFGQDYADQYDLLYKDKDYESECDLLEEVFRRYGHGPVLTVLDLGCGTGNHTVPLARRGYHVTGVDLSPDMVVHARQKVAADPQLLSSNAPTFVQGDVRSVDLSKSFDVVLMMFAVLGYQLTNDDVLAALRTVRRHLRPGGLFVCDFWYGPAVLTIRPADRAKIITIPGGKVLRMVTSKLDTRRHVCEVRYDLWRLIGNRVEAESEELHVVRYFFPMELELMLSQSGFVLISLTAFPTLDRPADETSWNVFGVASAI